MQASVTQGSELYPSRGRQCMANSISAIIAATHTSPYVWDKDNLDVILDKGDALVQDTRLKKTNVYWSTDAISYMVNGVQIKKVVSFPWNI